MNTDRLTPCLWNAPLKPYHLKPINADHIIGGKMRKSRIYICHDCGGLVAYISRACSTYLVDVKVTRRGRDYEVMRDSRHSSTCKPNASGAIHPTALAYIRRQEQLWQRVESTPIVGTQLMMDWKMDIAMDVHRDAERGI